MTIITVTKVHELDKKANKLALTMPMRTLYVIRCLKPSAVNAWSRLLPAPGAACLTSNR